MFGGLKNSSVEESLRQKVAQLEARCQQLESENRQLRERAEKLMEQNRLLLEQLEQAQALAFRQAAPFRRPAQRRVEKRRKPGRKPGHPGSCRPKPDHIDHFLEVGLECCPECGGQCLENLHRVEQFIEDLPKTRPEVTRLVTWRGWCPGCQRSVCSSHPMQVSLAAGAAGVHLGPRALGFFMELVYHHGLTHRRACKVLEGLTGLRLTPGGLNQAARRVAQACQGDYEQAILQLRQSQAVYGDETSWWVDGQSRWLWVFTTDQATVYRVDESRGRAVVHEILGMDFPGVLVSDCLSSYDDATAIQHKCYAHHQKAIATARKMREQARQPCDWLNCLSLALKTAQVLKAIKPEHDPKEWRQMRQCLEKRVDELLRSPPGDLEQRVANRFKRQRDHLFTFLDYESVEATNNRAERQLRPAVIARKLSGGNRSERGARGWEILVSTAATCAQKACSFVEFIAKRVVFNPTST